MKLFLFLLAILVSAIAHANDKSKFTVTQHAIIHIYENKPCTNTVALGIIKHLPEQRQREGWKAVDSFWMGNQANYGGCWRPAITQPDTYIIIFEDTEMRFFEKRQFVPSTDQTPPPKGKPIPLPRGSYRT